MGNFFSQPFEHIEHDASHSDADENFEDAVTHQVEIVTPLSDDLTDVETSEHRPSSPKVKKVNKVKKTKISLKKVNKKPLKSRAKSKSKKAMKKRVRFNLPNDTTTKRMNTRSMTVKTIKKSLSKLKST